MRTSCILCGWLLAAAGVLTPNLQGARAATSTRAPHDGTRIGKAATAAAGAPRALEMEEGLEKASDPWLPPAPLVTTTPAEPRIAGTTSVQVNVNANGFNILGDAANEPSIAIDPLHPEHIVIGWRQFDNVGSNFRQAGFGYSRDGGRTWTFGGRIQSGTFRSDPVLSWDVGGSVYYSSITDNGQGELPCTVFKSTNGGQTWSSGTYAFGGDKQWLAVDRSGGIGVGHLYLTWSTAGSVSANRTFTRSTNNNTTYPTTYDLPQNPRWGSLDVAPNGVLYLAGFNPNNTAQVLVAKSSNAQNRFAAPVFESVFPVNMGGGAAFFVAGSPNPDGLLGQVWIATDHSSGPTAGWIYLVASLDPPGTDPIDVMFTRSTDGGTTWSTPLRLNDDAAGNYQWFATLAVAPNGRIDIVWNDTRNTGVPNQSQLFYTSSADGGTTWTPDTQMSPTFDSWLGWPNQNKIGDYYQMVSDRVGADLAWAATFNGEQDVWYLRIGDRDCNGNGVGDATDIQTGASTDWNQNGRPDECEGLQVSDVESSRPLLRLGQNVPNPFLVAAAGAQTAIPFELPAAAASVRLCIYDVGGHLVRTLSGAAVAGRNVLSWDGNDAQGRAVGTGVYLYRLETPGSTAVRRIVLMR